MRSWLFLNLLLGVLPLLGEGVYPPGTCDSYQNISNPWRNANYQSHHVQFVTHRDKFLAGKWWRFVGVGGDILATWCVESGKGSSAQPVYLNTTSSLPQSESSTETVVSAGGTSHRRCFNSRFDVSIVLCPGGFYIFKPNTYPGTYSSFIIRHLVCQEDSCGPLAECFGEGLCRCLTGYSFGDTAKPVNTYLCEDNDECVDCNWPKSQCINFPGGYNCSCLTGYEPEHPSAPINESNPCNDIEECAAMICGLHADCSNSEGSYDCQCHLGFAQMNSTICEDIDECLDVTLCGPNSTCTNTIGLWSCVCDSGFRATNHTQQPSQDNICLDIDECVEEPTICGSNGDCTNTEGSFFCSCFSGFRLSSGLIGTADPCIDIDECTETPGLCGVLTVCFNKPGTYYCSCSDNHYPSTGIIWTEDTFCKSLQDVLDELEPSQDQTIEMAFLAYMDQQTEMTKGSFIPEAIIANCFSACMEVAGVGPYVSPPRVSSAGDGETGSIILDIAERFIGRLLLQEEKQLKMKLETPTFSLDLVTFGPEDKKSRSVPLTANQNVMEINMESLAKNNNGFAAAAFLVLHGMESLLSHQYFQTENMTQFSSDVFTAFLPAMNNTNLTEPVNFTIQHNKVVPESAVVSCVYWEVDSEPLLLTLRGQGEQEPRVWGWSEQGCWASYSDHNYTVCSCSHLSTFALILQTGEPPPQSDFLDWLNRICVIVGLFFFALAVLTFLLCSWNPKINNTARLHLCLNLGLSHFLLLFNDLYIKQPVACKALAGILHFLVVSSFVWMQLEAVQLFMLVRRLNRVQVIERDGLPKLVLYLIGYGVPLVVVGVSALVYHHGYGRTDADVCWLSTTRNFNWALTGPVIAILGLNCLLFLATLWSLRATLANMRSGASESSDIRLVLFKIVAQFVILGCTWILGLYQTNLFFQILFIVLNSQQGTFLYFVHCVLNKEIREECLKCLTCSLNKDQTEDDVVSVTEDNTRAND